MLRLVVFLGSVFVPALLASYGFKDLIPLGLCKTPANLFLGNASELFCPQLDSDFFFPSAEKLEFKHSRRPIVPVQLERFQNGFFKSTCFPETINYDLEELCIFVNLAVNHGKGMVIIASENTLKESFENGLDLSEDPIDPEAMKVVRVPEKGGMGAVATRDLQMGDHVILERPVGLFPTAQQLWYTDYGMKIRRQAIDHLPVDTRAAVARLYGTGDSEDDFLSDVVNKNVFSASLPGDPDMSYGALVLDGSRLNHACRPNVAYHIDQHTMFFHMHANEPIKAGMELTDTYRTLTLSRETRRASLKATYGFDCTCSLCQLSEEEGKLSDQRVLRMTEIASQDAISPEELHELLDHCEKENIPWYRLYANYKAAMYYNTQGKAQKVKEHANLARKLALLLSGPNWDEMDDLDMLLIAPDRHHSHFSRQT